MYKILHVFTGNHTFAFLENPIGFVGETGRYDCVAEMEQKNKIQGN